VAPTFCQAQRVPVYYHPIQHTAHVDRSTIGHPVDPYVSRLPAALPGCFYPAFQFAINDEYFCRLCRICETPHSRTVLCVCGVNSMSKRGKHPSGLPSRSAEERYRSLFDNRPARDLRSPPFPAGILNINPGPREHSSGIALAEEMKRNIKNAYRRSTASRKQREKVMRGGRAGACAVRVPHFPGDKSQGLGFTSITRPRRPRKTAYYEGFFIDITERKENVEKLGGRRATIFSNSRSSRGPGKIAHLNRELAADIAASAKRLKGAETANRPARRAQHHPAHAPGISGRPIARPWKQTDHDQHRRPDPARQSSARGDGSHPGGRLDQSQSLQENSGPSPLPS